MARSGDNSPCLTCQMKPCDCGCQKIVEVVQPSFGWKNGKPKPKLKDWSLTNAPTKYTLPPIDKDTYNVTGTAVLQSELKKVTHKPILESIEKPELKRQTHQQEPTAGMLHEDNFYKRSHTCWCRDCLWLIFYLLLMLIWLGLVTFCWVKAPSQQLYEEWYMKSPELVHKSSCYGICILLEPPSKEDQKYQPKRDGFNCSIGRDLWVPFNGSAEDLGKRKPANNCIEFCELFKNKAEFVKSCVRSPGNFDNESSQRALETLLQLSGMREFALDQNFWHWIVHLVVTTNAISLLLLLVQLFFCCAFIAMYAVCSILSASILMSLLWYDVWDYLQNFQYDYQETGVCIWACAIASTLFTCHIVINSVLAMRRYHATCAVASLASKFVNSIPSILFEAVWTLFLLCVWHMIVLFGILGCESLVHYGSPAGVMLWIVRGLTMFLAYWTVQLIINCQTIIIHGAMSNHYFHKDMKEKVATAHIRLIKYHVCTACFAALLFNWLYWTRWIHSKSRIRTQTLYGTAIYGERFCPAGKTVRQLLDSDTGVKRNLMSQPNHYYFLSQTLVVTIIAIVSHICFSLRKTNEAPTSWYCEILMVGYSYYVSLAIVNIYRVTKDAIFLSYMLDRSLSFADPNRIMKLPFEETAFHTATSRSARVVPGSLRS